MSSKKLARRYKLEPDIAVIKAENKPEATGASKITGICDVPILRAPNLLTVLLAAFLLICFTDSKSLKSQAFEYHPSRCIPLLSSAITVQSIT